MRTIKLSLLLLAALLFSAAPVLAGAPEWIADQPHTSFRFSVKHIFSTVSGSFESYLSTINFDPDNLEESKISFKIKVNSIQTGVAKRDNHLRSADFFEASKYPEITFESTAMKHLEGDRYAIAGKLTIKDVSKDVILPMTYHGSKDHPMDPKNMVAGFDIETVIDRLEYHVGDGKFYQRGLVGKDVDVFVSVEMLREKL